MLYLKANGRPLTKHEIDLFDKANITVYVPSWKTIPQDSTDTFAYGTGYVSTGMVFFEICDGSWQIGNSWLCGRGYTTQAGLAMTSERAPENQSQLPADVSL
jgi:hypothetical protein